MKTKILLVLVLLFVAWKLRPMPKELTDRRNPVMWNSPLDLGLSNQYGYVKCIGSMKEFKADNYPCWQTVYITTSSRAYLHDNGQEYNINFADIDFEKLHKFKRGMNRRHDFGEQSIELLVVEPK